MSDLLTTPRVIVTPLRRSDGDDLIAANRENVAYHTPWIAAFTERDGFEALLDKCATTANASFVARERETGDLVAIVNLNEIVLGLARSAYLGYWGYARTGGRGLAGEALAAVIRHAFDEIGLHRVEANIQAGNARSIALVKRAGFRPEGVARRYLFIAGEWRDHEHWTRLADDADEEHIRGSVA